MRNGRENDKVAKFRTGIGFGGAVVRYRGHAPPADTPKSDKGG
jgi:hypothetical protein